MLVFESCPSAMGMAARCGQGGVEVGWPSGLGIHCDASLLELSSGAILHGTGQTGHGPKFLKVEQKNREGESRS